MDSLRKRKLNGRIFLFPLTPIWKFRTKIHKYIKIPILIFDVTDRGLGKNPFSAKWIAFYSNILNEIISAPLKNSYKRVLLACFRNFWVRWLDICLIHMISSLILWTFQYIADVCWSVVGVDIEPSNYMPPTTVCYPFPHNSQN